MSEFVLNSSGATITLTNVSTSTTFAVENGFISPTLINPNLNETGETPAFSIQIPSFVSYKYNTIQPGDSITFESTNKDEILYYYNISKNPFAGISVIVTPNGGGGSAVLIDKTITANGVYNAVDDEADGYSTVNVEVANTYTNEDEGKVVDSGVLVAQTARETEITENGIYDTTLNNSVTVNVSSVDDFDIKIKCVPGQFSPGTTFSFNSGVTDVVFSGDITGFQSGVFDESSDLVSCTILGSVTAIPDYMFYSCASLESVQLPNTITSFGSAAFHSCGLTSIALPNSLETIQDNCFNSCRLLTFIRIPGSVSTIGDSSFNGCYALSEVIIDDSNTPLSIYGQTFYGAIFTTITIPSRTNYIDDITFDGCENLQTIIINKPEGSIEGAPWGAPETCQVIWND